ncbi:CGNR zinc finger domain-containing protein [Agreia sp. VKM Ac-1783]|uniref:CGNR zinc finger domain-containing protein n=1 Tax=Agreia sp. VKM Ac-1783 TaxID=1938889 RepID=UPI000A2ACBF9|nr:CGNR zinc finger domain-containing protein [Agreia sp. VKM Ac-1783]SMQ59498.1 Putative stress-induced transcription regulator [Agreia sp. VKM Ac-1783]
MHFAPDTEDILGFIVTLGNTVAGASRTGADEIATPVQLTELLDAHGYTGRFDRDERELAQVHRVRTQLRHVWNLERDAAAVEVNAMLRQTRALPQLVRHDAFDWHLHASDDDEPLADRILSEASLAFIDVIRTDEMTRLRSCAASDCEGIFADLSRNGSKRFCSVRCGNRMNMIAFRERAAADST